MASTISLDGAWKLRWNDGERGDRLERMLQGTADLSRAWDAEVPGTVQGTLIRHGVIADPNAGANILNARWVEETIWYYHRTFRAPRRRGNERAWLVFDRLDLAAAIHLNGKEIARHANAFYPCRVEVTDQLRAGLNSLVVAVESGLFHAANRSADGYAVNVAHQFTKRPWLRKTQSAHGWDWSPRLLNVGIPGSVRIEYAERARWEDLAVTATLSEGLDAGAIRVRVMVEGLESRAVDGTLSVRVKETRDRVSVPVAIKPGMQGLEAVVPVRRPDLWWPAGHGAQPLYTVAVALEAGGARIGRATRRTAFRHVRINQDRHPVSGRRFVVEINGKPIFCKGGNFVPADLVLSSIRRERYEVLVDRAIEANANFLRVWGGGLYESDDFYELCDEKGVLVWQEFVFACAKYPATDPAFLADVKREAAFQIRRLAHHPSLIVWCGNNEMEQGNWHWGYQNGVAHPDYALFHMVLPRLVAGEDGTRYYQPSSPWSPDGADPIRDDTGDQHPWSIGFGDTDFRKYREMACRFPNEGGILGPVSLPTLRACLAGGPEKIGSFAWELHDNSVSYWHWAPAYAPDRMIADWIGRPVRDMGIEDYAYWGGLVQGAALEEYIRNFRRRMFDSSSAIFWMYNDVWPCTRSWTIVDYYLRRTPAYWPVRRAFAPLAVVVARQKDTVRIYGVNEGPAWSGMLRYGFMRLAGGYPLDIEQPANLPANASTPLAELDGAKWDRLGVESHLAFAILREGGRERARHALVLPRFSEMRWPEARVAVRWADGRAVFRSSAFAWRVCVDLDGARALPDNFFDVYPGVPTVLEWPEALGRPRVLRVGNGAGA